MPSSAVPSRLRSLRSLRHTVRGRVLTTMLAFMAAGLLITGVIAHWTQARAVDARHQAELEQEISELLLVAETRNDDGTLRHTNVDSLMRAATESAAPSSNESVLALIDGQPAYAPREQDFELVGSGYLPRILEAAEAEPDATQFLSWDSGERDIVVAIAPVQVLDDPAAGLFVVAIDQGPEKRVIWRSAAQYLVICLLVLAVAAVVGNAASRRMLQPLADLREASSQVTVRELARRVEVPHTDDDVAGLAKNFNRMLERLETGVGEQRRFTSDVGHELRTPITIVQGTLEMTDVEDPADVRESHDIALEELQRMNRVVSDLSELAKSGRPDYVVPERVDMREFAEDAFARISKLGEREWILAHAADVTGWADEQRLMQAVIQLAANAVRYSEEGSGIRFGVDWVNSKDGPEIHVSVVDQGIGIAREDQQRIFERFQRVDEEAAARGGTGLGLSIVKAIMDGHDGEVRLYSRPGQGSTFTLVIPQPPDEEDEYR